MKHITFILLMFLNTLTCFANTYYVKTRGNDTSNDGRSWGAAFATLQKALEVSQYGDQIWIAEGTYKPTAYPAGAIPYTPPLTNRDKSFYLVNGVKLYGGFTGCIVLKNPVGSESNPVSAATAQCNDTVRKRNVTIRIPQGYVSKVT